MRTCFAFGSCALALAASGCSTAARENNAQVSLMAYEHVSKPLPAPEIASAPGPTLKTLWLQEKDETTRTLLFEALTGSKTASTSEHHFAAAAHLYRLGRHDDAVAVWRREMKYYGSHADTEIADVSGVMRRLVTYELPENAQRIFKDEKYVERTGHGAGARERFVEGLAREVAGLGAGDVCIVEKNKILLGAGEAKQQRFSDYRLALNATADEELDILVIECRVIGYDAAGAGLPVPLEDGPDKMKNGELRFDVLDAQGEREIAAWSTSTRGVRVLGSPRLSIFEWQRGSISVANQIHYTRDYEIRDDGGADPVIDTILDGMSIDVRAATIATGVFLDAGVVVSSVALPIAELRTTVRTKAGDVPVTIQLPEAALSSGRGQGALGLGLDQSCLLHGLSVLLPAGEEGEASMTRQSLVIVLTVHRAGPGQEEIAPRGR